MSDNIHRAQDGIAQSSLDDVRFAELISGMQPQVVELDWGGGIGVFTGEVCLEVGDLSVVADVSARGDSCIIFPQSMMCPEEVERRVSLPDVYGVEVYDSEGRIWVSEEKYSTLKKVVESKIIIE